MRYLVIGLLLLSVSDLAVATNYKATAAAKAVMAQINRVAYKYPEVEQRLNEGLISLDAPEPQADADGKFLLPMNQYGQLTAWAEDAISTRAVGATSRGSGAVGVNLPIGQVTLRDGTGKSISDIDEIGGWERIRETSQFSFDSLTDYSLYLHAEFQGTDEYRTMLSAAIVIYPKLERAHGKTIEKAYRNLQKVHGLGR